MNKPKNIGSSFLSLRNSATMRFSAGYVITAWVLLQLAEITFPAFGIGDQQMRQLVVAVAAGFPIILFMAWMFELRKSSGNNTQRTHESIIITVLGIASAGFAYLLWLPDMDQTSANSAAASTQSTNHSVPSIAVMPFVNMSNNIEDEYFSDGIAEELLNGLAKLEGLHVTARTSSFAYKGSTMDMREIGTQLNVVHILEGSVRRSDDMLRITAQLIDAKTGFHIWSETYDRQRTDIFQIQDEISQAIVAKLKISLLGTEKELFQRHPTQNFEAYDLYLEGRHLAHLRTAESIEKAIVLYKEAITKDKFYVPAYTGLSDAYILLASYGNMQLEDAIPLAREAVNTALSLRDDVSEAWASKGLLHTAENLNQEAADAFERSIELDSSNAQAHLWYGNILLQLKQDDKALYEYESAFRIDSNSWPANSNLSGQYWKRGRYLDAMQHLLKMAELQPESAANSKAQAAFNLLASGRISQAIPALLNALAMYPENEEVMIWLSEAYLQLGDTATAELWANRAHASSPLDQNTLNAELNIDIALARPEQAIIRLNNKLKIAEKIGEIKTVFLIRAQRGIILAELDRTEEAKLDLDYILEQTNGLYTTGKNVSEGSIRIASFFFTHTKGEKADKAEIYLKGALEQLTINIDKGYHDIQNWLKRASIRAIFGQYDAAISDLNSAKVLGWRAVWTIERDPSLKTLFGMQAFKSLSQEIKKLIQAEKDFMLGKTLPEYVAPSEHTIVTLTPEDLAMWVGNYMQAGSSDSPLIRITNDNGQLVMQKGARPARKMIPVADNEFIIDYQSDHYRFVTNNSGEVTHFLKLAIGGAVRFPLIDYQEPEIISINPTILQDYIGSYTFEESSMDMDLGTVEIKIQDGNLVGIIPGNPATILYPTSKDEFYIKEARALFRFERTEEKVDSLRLDIGQRSVAGKKL